MQSPIGLLSVPNYLELPEGYLLLLNLIISLKIIDFSR